MDYLEVRARTVDLAVEAAMTELGVADREQLAVEVLQEPEKGFLGFGGTGRRGPGHPTQDPKTSQ